MFEISKYCFDADILRALADIDNIPTTDANEIEGIPGRLFIVAPKQLEELDFIIKTLDAIPPSEFETMKDSEKMELSTLLNKAIRVRKNSISR